MLAQTSFLANAGIALSCSCGDGMSARIWDTVIQRDTGQAAGENK